MIPTEGSELVLSKAVLQKWCIRRAPPSLLAWYLFNPQPHVYSGNACGLQSVVCWCSWGLLGFCVLSASKPSCIFSGGWHCGSACSWNGSLHLRWLFAFGRDCQLPALTLFVLLLDYSKGFGGKYGVQKDRMDKVSSFKEPWLQFLRVSAWLDLHSSALCFWTLPQSKSRVLCFSKSLKSKFIHRADARLCGLEQQQLNSVCLLPCF